MRLVPDTKAVDALAALKAHLAKRGFGDIEVNMTGGYDPTSTSKGSPLIQAQLATYRKFGIDALLWPRNAGSDPVTFSRANRSSSPPAISVSVTAAAPTRRTNTT
jgi:acetylornithine deacetylase/succinyl-diaminopimelate desuccinylase-like protein